MRQRIIYLLKHNTAIQWLYRVVMSACFRFLGLFVPQDDHLILFVSFMGKSVSDSPKAMFDYLQAHPEEGAFRCVWALEKPEEIPHAQCVKIDTLPYFLTALKARYWVTNTNIERGLRFKKKSTVYLNTWHGIALKTIGNDCPGRNDYNFDTLNYLAVSGRHDEKVFQSAFHARSETYLRCGMPRNDALWNATEADHVRLRKQLNLPTDKKVILYAPTWRDSTDGGKTYDVRLPIHLDEWQRRLGDQYVVLLRAHHMTTKLLGVQFNDFVRDASSYPDVNDLMIASDLLITDYSAVAFDYSILCKPIVCFAYDYDSYLADRGTYFNMDEVYPNPSCRTEEDLLSRILGLNAAQEKENTRVFRDRFVEYHRNATETCVHALLGKPLGQ